MLFPGLNPDQRYFVIFHEKTNSWSIQIACINQIFLQKYFMCFPDTYTAPETVKVLKTVLYWHSLNLYFRAGSTFPVPVCTVLPGNRVNKADLK